MINKDRLIRDANRIYDSLVFNKKHTSPFINEEDINSIKDSVNKDLEFFFESDPAANSIDEIKVTYPGFRAITFYRLIFWRK